MVLRLKLLTVKDLIVSVGIEVLAGIIVAITIFIWSIHRKLVSKYYNLLIVKRWKKMARVNELLSDLALEIDCLYVHIIKYHNGKGIPSPTKTTRLTILWEEIGNSSVKRIKEEWQGSPVINDWIKIVNHTLKEDGLVNHWCKCDLSETQKGIWAMYDIGQYYEVYISSKSYGFFTLGISTKGDLKLTEAEKHRIERVALQLRELL